MFVSRYCKNIFYLLKSKYLSLSSLEWGDKMSFKLDWELTLLREADHFARAHAYRTPGPVVKKAELDTAGLSPQ